MGYRIDIDQAGCITCGICMDVCPVEALDMTRPQRAGHRDRPGSGPPAAVDDGAPAPGRRVHRLRHLHPRVPAQRDDARRRYRRGAARARQGPIDRPAAAPRRAPGSRCRSVTREALKPDHDSPWGDLFTWRTAVAAEGVAGLDVDGRRRAGRSRSRPARSRARPAPTRAGTSG